MRRRSATDPPSQPPCPNRCDKEIHEHAHPRRGVRAAGKHRVDRLDIARIIFLQYRHERTARNLIGDAECADARDADPAAASCPSVSPLFASILPRTGNENSRVPSRNGQVGSARRKLKFRQLWPCRSSGTLGVPCRAR